MKKNKDRLIDELMKKISQLPPDRQKAVCFIIDNFDIIKKMCENSEMTDEDIQNRLAKAEENNDCITAALLAAVRLFNEK